MASGERAVRVGRVVKAEIADLLTRGVKDPRVGFVSIMGVKMSPDLNYANVYVSLFGTEKEKKSSLIGLKNSAGWIRKQIGGKLRLRVTPEIRFYEDNSLDEVFHLDDVFRELHENENPDDENDRDEVE